MLVKMESSKLVSIITLAILFETPFFRYCHYVFKLQWCTFSTKFLTLEIVWKLVSKYFCCATWWVIFLREFRRLRCLTLIESPWCLFMKLFFRLFVLLLWDIRANKYSPNFDEPTVFILHIRLWILMYYELVAKLCVFVLTSFQIFIP